MILTLKVFYRPIVTKQMIKPQKKEKKKKLIVIKLKENLFAKTNSDASQH